MPPLRHTRQRSAIHRALLEAGRPLSPAELLAAARRGIPDLGMATVYRTIKKLMEDRQAVAVDIPGEPARYESAGKPHHHHFLCRSCHRMYELPGCPVVLDRFTPKGFEVDGHELTIYGRCTECRPRRTSKRGAP
jgi:Fur family ferric uptake transcriptional regulator